MQQPQTVSSPGNPTLTLRRSWPELLGIAFVAIIVFSFHMWGVKVFYFKGISIAPWDIATLLIAFLWLGHGYKHPIRFPKTLRSAALIMILLIVWISLQALRSPEPDRAVTMILLILRDLMLLIMVGSMVTYIENMEKLNKVVFLLGAVIASVSLILYLANVDVTGSRRPFGGIILMSEPQSGFGQILRLLGFARDPNFYAMFISISFFCGLVTKRVGWIVRWGGLLVIAMSLVLALSRTALVAVPLSMFLFLVASSLSTGHLGVLPRRYLRSSLAVAGVGLVVVIGASFLNDRYVEQALARFASSPDTPRIQMWSDLASDLNVLVMGGGLRSAEVALEGRYSHNSYLDITFETGVIGMLLWLAFVAYVCRIALVLIRTTPEMAPWVQSLLMVLLMMITLSILFHPIFWVVSAVVLAQGSRAGKASNPRVVARTS